MPPRAACADVAIAAHYVLGRIEADAARRHRSHGYRAPLVVAAVPRARPDTELVPNSGKASRSKATLSVRPNSASVSGWVVAELEGWQHYFATDEGAPPSEAGSMLVELHAMAMIPSGKRGSRTPRHPLPERGKSGVRPPAMIRSESEVAYAQQLLDWLADLRATRPEDYKWLLDKWLYASEAQEGLMRLSGSEVGRARLLPRTIGVLPEVRAGHISARRTNSGTTATTRLRIQLARNGAPLASVAPDAGYPDSPCNVSQNAGRSARVVRWVLTWLAAEQCATVRSHTNVV